MTIILYITIAILALVAVLLFFSRNKILREKKESDKKLTDTLADLENVYSEINTTQEELNAKYREIKVNEEKIKKLAYEDAITGLPNEAAFNEMLVHIMETLRKEEAVGVMSIDLDNFKLLDDVWGHNNCDELILDVSHRLRQNIGEDDYLAKLSSDEFMILNQNIKETQEFDEKVRKIRDAFRQPFIASFGQVLVTVSIGVSIAPKDTLKAETLIKNAAMALAEAKHLGKDCYCYYSEEMSKRELEKIELQSKITAATKNDSFIIKYEPVINLEEKTYEAVRMKLLWDRGENGIWQANKFINFVDKTGQSFVLAINSLIKICQDMKLFPNKKVILPLSKKLFFSYEFREKIYEVIEESKIDLERFIIEIDEDIIISNIADSSFVMEEMISKGLSFRVGRYGKGGMSMEILRDLPITQVAVPIDRILLEHDEEESEKYISLINLVVTNLGKQVSFTSISDSIEEDLVIRSGAKLVEGELYGAMLDAHEVE